MTTSGEGRRARLSIDVEPELRRKIKIAAAERDLSIRDYVVTVLRRALTADERSRAPAEDAAWAHLSAGSFARDWESEEDQVYDRLP